jgi:hypothetical protein
MRTLGIVISGFALLAVAYGGFSLWRTAEQLNQVSATFVREAASVRQSEEAEERARVPLHAESPAPELDAPQSADFADGGFADSSAAESWAEEEYAETELEPTYAELPDGNAEPAFDEVYSEPELEDVYAEAEPPVEEFIDDSDATAALQALLADPDPEVRDEAARLLQALQADPSAADSQ